MNKFYWVHLDCEGFIGYCKTYEEAEKFCREYMDVVGEDGSFEWDDANGGLQILALAAESHIEETRYRKDYFENEESMTEEEYEAACEEYGCLDPDSPECWFTRMRKTPVICSPWRAVKDGLPDFLCQMGGVDFWNGLAAVGGMVLPVSYDTKGWHSMGCLLPEDQVTHWMPLPPPPEPEIKPEIGITEGQ